MERLNSHLLVLLLLFVGQLVAANSQPYDELVIFLDADQTGAVNSGRSIHQGMTVAINQAGGQVSNIPLRVVIKDHRGNSRRSLKHLQQYLSTDNALAVFSGLHSPPLLAHREFINDEGILVMDPWAAAGPITRTEGKNWIFRLSIDDTKAGKVIVSNALKEGLNKPFLLLEDTGWGRSNLKNMSAALKQQNKEPIGIKWFNWGLSENSARIMLREIKQSGADSLYLVANAPEGKTFARAMLSLRSEERLPIRSHWGITGGDFAEQLGQNLQDLDLKFIQTRFSFLDAMDTQAQRVFGAAKKAFTSIDKPEDIKAATGFVHSYDLMLILIAAIEQAGLSGDIVNDRRNVKLALEDLTAAINGLIKVYQKPFAAEGFDSHEALNSNDYSMGYFDSSGVIRLVQQETK